MKRKTSTKNYLKLFVFFCIKAVAPIAYTYDLNPHTHNDGSIERERE